MIALNVSKRRLILENRSLTPVLTTGEGFLNVSVIAVQPQVLSQNHFLPADEIRRSVQNWIGIPVTIRHPPDAAPGDSQDAWIRQNQLGVITGAEMNQDDQLRVDVRIDLPQSGLGQQIVEKLQSGKMVEVSTGYFAHGVEAEGKINGKDYDHVAVNIEPWHLAFLPDQVGACSIADGCGALRNHQERPVKTPKTNDANEPKRNELSLDQIQGKVRQALDAAHPMQYIRVISVGSDRVIYMSEEQDIFARDYTIGASNEIELGEPQAGTLDFEASNTQSLLRQLANYLGVGGKANQQPCGCQKKPASNEGTAADPAEGTNEEQETTAMNRKEALAAIQNSLGLDAKQAEERYGKLADDALIGVAEGLTKRNDADPADPAPKSTPETPAADPQGSDQEKQLNQGLERLNKTIERLESPAFQAGLASIENSGTEELNRQAAVLRQSGLSDEDINAMSPALRQKLANREIERVGQPTATELIGLNAADDNDDKDGVAQFGPARYGAAK